MRKDTTSDRPRRKRWIRIETVSVALTVIGIIVGVVVAIALRSTGPKDTVIRVFREQDLRVDDLTVIKAVCGKASERSPRTDAHYCFQNAINEDPDQAELEDPCFEGSNQTIICANSSGRNLFFERYKLAAPFIQTWIDDGNRRRASLDEAIATTRPWAIELNSPKEGTFCFASVIDAEETKPIADQYTCGLGMVKVLDWRKFQAGEDKRIVDIDIKKLGVAGHLVKTDHGPWTVFFATGGEAPRQVNVRQAWF